jgi:hypothetical protein
MWTTLVLALLLLLPLAAACPNDAPCNCSPNEGVRDFEDACAAEIPGGAAQCAAALVRAGINVTLLARRRTHCGYFGGCDPRDGASCTVFTARDAGNNVLNAAFCTGKCFVQDSAIARVVLLGVAVLVLVTIFVVLGYACIVRRRRTRPRRARFALREQLLNGDEQL